MLLLEDETLSGLRTGRPRLSSATPPLFLPLLPFCLPLLFAAATASESTPESRTAAAAAAAPATAPAASASLAAAVSALPNGDAPKLLPSLGAFSSLLEAASPRERGGRGLGTEIVPRSRRSSSAAAGSSREVGGS